MAPVTIYADFNNADADGRVRLNGAGSIRDLSRLGLQLQNGTSVTIHDEELAADGEAEYSAEEGLWTVRIDWTLTRSWSYQPVTTETVN